MFAGGGDVGEPSDPDTLPDPRGDLAAIDIATGHAWRSLDPYVVTVWRLRTLLNAALGIVVVGPVAYIGVVQARPWVERVAFVMLALTFMGSVAGLATAPWRYRRWRWRLDPVTFELESGLWETSNERVPIDRIHTMTITQGPLLRRRSLFQVSLYASGTTGMVIIPAVGADDVAELQRRLGFER